MYKKGGLYSSVDKLINSTPSNYELKTDHNLVSNLAETESATHTLTHTPLPTQKMPSEKRDKVKSKVNPTNDGSIMMSDNSLKVAGEDHEV